MPLGKCVPRCCHCVKTLNVWPASYLFYSNATGKVSPSCAWCQEYQPSQFKTAEIPISKWPGDPGKKMLENIPLTTFKILFLKCKFTVSTSLHFKMFGRRYKLYEIMRACLSPSPPPPKRLYLRYPSQATEKNLLMNNPKWHPTKFVADDEDIMATEKRFHTVTSPVIFSNKENFNWRAESENLCLLMF